MDYSEYKAQNRFTGLDGIRAISVLAVIWHHTAASVFPEVTILQQGHHGVSLFFVISGFLITSLLLREKTRSEINLKRFYIRRSLRIFPLYYAVLIAYVLAVLFIENDVKIREDFFDNLPYFATYTSNIFVPLIIGERVIFYFAWSLAVEEQFYLIWPWVEKYLSESVIMIGIIAFIILLMFLNTRVMEHYAFAQIITKIFVIPICLGVLLAHLLNSENSYHNIKPALVGKYASVIYFLLLLLSLSSHAVPSIFGYVLMMMFIGSSVISSKSVMNIVLENKFVMYVGKISYGIYLMHMLSYNVVKLVIDELSLTNWEYHYFLTCILSIIVASVSFHTFEKYFNLKKLKYSS